jgi:hypothetical protein
MRVSQKSRVADRFGEQLQLRVNRQVGTSTLIARSVRVEAKEMLRRQRGRCIYCEFSLERAYHIDHKTPLSRNGSKKVSNLQLLCPMCNSLKRHLTDREYQRYFAKWQRRFLAGLDGGGHLILFRTMPFGLQALSGVIATGEPVYYCHANGDDFVTFWWKKDLRHIGIVTHIGLEQWLWVKHVFKEFFTGTLRARHGGQAPREVRNYIRIWRIERQERARRQARRRHSKRQRRNDLLRAETTMMNRNSISEVPFPR